MVLRASNLSKSFGTVTKVDVFEGWNVDVNDNSTTSIMGPSGCGKSTLLHLLAGLEKPDAGSIVWFENQELDSFSDKQLSKFRAENIGFVFQFHNLLPEFTAVENVIIPQLILGRSYKEAEKEAESLLYQLSLGERFYNRPSELSGGEQQRVSFARALINRPKVIFADEPTGNLDSSNTEILLNIMFEYQKEYGLALVMVTHDKKVAEKCASQLQIFDGKLVEVSN